MNDPHGFSAFLYYYDLWQDNHIQISGGKLFRISYYYIIKLQKVTVLQNHQRPSQSLSNPALNKPALF